MPYDDLENDDAGDQALDELGATLTDDGQEESDDEPNEDAYDPVSEPSFGYDKSETQHTVYSLPDVWDELDGSAGLLFDAEIELRQDGIENIHKRELHNALFAKAVERLDGEDLADAVREFREEREEGPLL